MPIETRVGLLVSVWDLTGRTHYSKIQEGRHTGSHDFFPTGKSLRRFTSWLCVNKRFHRLVLECAWLRTAVRKASWCSHGERHVTYLKALAWFSNNAKKNGWKTNVTLLSDFFSFFFPNLMQVTMSFIKCGVKGWQLTPCNILVMRDCFKHWEREKSGL